MLMLSGVPFEKLGYKPLPERSFASQSETLQHTLYGGLVLPMAVLGVLTWVARRNVKEFSRRRRLTGGPMVNHGKRC
jgi:hypothetical protein